MGVVSRRWMWVESVGVVVRRYIDYFILLILTPLVSVFFAAASLIFVHFLKCFSFLYNLALILVCSPNTCNITVKLR